MNTPAHVSVLGLGEMGRALASALAQAGHPLTVWNRTPRSVDLPGSDVHVAATLDEAVSSGDVLVVCLFDHASVHQTLDPLADLLRNRSIINLTTTSPDQARELAAWAGGLGARYLDGGIMAVPSMIGGAAAEILYSGDELVFTENRDVLDVWARSTFFGSDAGLASLYDIALLAGMYVMFAGYMQGAALVATAGVSATEFAERSAAWLSAMTGELAGFGRVIDGGDFGVDGQQSLDFSELSKMIEAAEDAGVGSQPLQMVQRLIQAQRDAGHGADGFARIYESVRAAEVPTESADSVA